MIFIKIFLVLAGIWNLMDGIASIRLRSLGHSWISDTCRVIRYLIGIGLIFLGFYL